MKASHRKMLPFKLTSTFAATALGASLFFSASAPAKVWRNDISNTIVVALAQQQQFAGSGTVSVSGASGSGVAIAPGWVLTAAHVVRNRASASFILEGVTYRGVPVTTTNSDVALIRLNANAQLPASTPFISPNPGFDPTNELVWKAGRGQSGSVADSQAGNLSPSGLSVRAGTNIVTSTRNQLTTGVGPTDAIIFQQNNTAGNSTDFEVSTAPGDSGGAMYYQRDNQWFIAGITTGVVGGVGFVDADVFSVYDWIETETGLTFAPQAAPTEQTFDSDFTDSGVQSTALSGFGKIWNNDRPMFTGGPDGFNYTWENDFAPVAVFGTADSEPSVVSLQDAITYSGIRFDETDPNGGTGPFQIVDGGGTLRAVIGGSTIETNRFSAISATLIGAGNRPITKTGHGELLLNGDNSTFDAQINIDDGTLIVSNAAALGTGDFVSTKKTVVADGATLQLRGPGITSNEHIHINGTGIDGNGAIFISNGDHTLTERIALLSDSTLNVTAGNSVSISGDQGRFYTPGTDAAPRVLTQLGDGIVAYDNFSGTVSLLLEDGVAAGDGGFGGSVTLGDGGELRVGDSTTSDEIGAFRTGDFIMEAGSLLKIDLDPMMNIFDQLNVEGDLALAGILSVNLQSAPTLGQSFLIVDNDLTESVTGTFSNASFVTGIFDGSDYHFMVDYASGTGNDISLTSVAAIPEPGSLSLLLLVAAAGCARRRRPSIR